MQDKRLHINKKFTDRAWSEMKHLLDQELPTDEKRNKRPLIWWYTGAAVLAASVVAFFILFNFNTPQNNPENFQNTPAVISEYDQKNNIEINENKLMNARNDIEINKNKSTNDQNNIETKINNYPKKAAINFNENKNNIKKEKIIYENPTNSNFKNNIKNTTENPSNIIIEKNIPQKEIIIAGVEQQSTEQKYLSEKNSPNKKNDPITTQTPNRHDIGHLTQLPLKKLDNPTHSKPPIVPTKKFSKSPGLVAYSSSIFNFGRGTNGFDAGVLKKIEFKNKKWWLETGLGYSNLTQSLSYVIEQEVNPASMEAFEVVTDYTYGTNESREDNNGGFSNNQPSLILRNSLEKLKLHYLNIPILMNRKFGRFFISSGIHTDVLLYASNGNTSGGFLQSLNDNKNENADLAPSNHFADRINSEPYANFDFSGIIGGGFAFNKNVSAKISYHHGLKDVLKNNFDEDFNRYFQFTLRYGW